MEGKDWLVECHESEETIYKIAQTLKDYSNSFYHIGNPLMGGQLYKCYDTLYKAIEKINNTMAGINITMKTTKEK